MEHSGPTHLPLGDGEERGPLGRRGTKAKTVAAFLAPVDAFFFFFCPKSEFWRSMADVQSQSRDSRLNYQTPLPLQHLTRNLHSERFSSLGVLLSRADSQLEVGPFVSDVLVTTGWPRVAPLVSCLSLPRPEFSGFTQVSGGSSE